MIIITIKPQFELEIIHAQLHSTISDSSTDRMWLKSFQKCDLTDLRRFLDSVPDTKSVDFYIKYALKISSSYFYNLHHSADNCSPHRWFLRLQRKGTDKWSAAQAQLLLLQKRRGSKKGRSRWRKSRAGKYCERQPRWWCYFNEKQRKARNRPRCGEYKLKLERNCNRNIWDFNATNWR